MMASAQSFEDLPVGGLRNLLKQFSSEDRFGNPSELRTGRILLLENEHKKEGSVYFDKGNIYAVTFTGFIPPIASRLYTGGEITEEQFRYLHQFPSEQVGELVVQHKYTTKEIVDNINRQMILSSLTYLYNWKHAKWTWEDLASFSDFTIPGLPTTLLLGAAEERAGQLDAIARNFPQVAKALAIPVPGPDWDRRSEIDASPEMQRIASMVDGKTTIAKIAGVCGFTRFEIAARMAKSINDGILLLPDPDGEVIEEKISSKDQAELDEATRALSIARNAMIQAEKNLEDIQFRLGKTF